MATGNNHQKRFAKWRNLAPVHTRALADVLESELIPPLLRDGFCRVEHYCDDRDDPVSGREIQLERRRDGGIEYISLAFEKWGRPQFQVTAGWQPASGSTELRRWAHVVARNGQYLHFWG